MNFFFIEWKCRYRYVAYIYLYILAIVSVWVNVGSMNNNLLLGEFNAGVLMKF